MLAHPVSDPGFATNKVHGSGAQRELYREAVKWCKTKRAAIDAGAHIGLWTRMMAEDFDSVLAVEPNEENFSCLARNAATPNVVLLRGALGALEGTAAQTMPVGGNSGMWYLAPGFDFNVHTIDGFGRTDVDLIKIDVEGYEGAVLIGAWETLIKSNPVVVFEDNGNGPKYFGHQWINPKHVLRELGYKVRLRWRKDEVWIKS